jgi:tetratricopeptide (TPR) repeat protein
VAQGRDLRLEYLSMKHRIIALLLVVVFAGALWASALEKELLANGYKFYEKKDYSGAADYLGQVVDMNPGNDQARFYLIYSLLFSGSQELALRHTQVLQRKHPNESSYTVLAAQIKEELKKLEQIKKEANKSTLIPKEVIFGGYEPKTVSREVKREPAPERERITSRSRPKTPLDHAITAIDNEEYEEATKALKNILRSDPKSYMAYHQLGVIDFNLGQYNEAIKNFRKALEITPRHFQSQFLLANTYKELGNYKLSEREFKRALGIHPDMFAQQNLAEVYIKMGQIDKAAQLYTEILDVAPDFSDAKAGLSKVKHLLGRNTEALSLINELMDEGKHSGETSYMKAMLLFESQAYNEAIAEATNLIGNYPSNYSYKAFYAKCLLKVYDFDNAMRVLSEVLQARPDNIDGKLVLAEAYLVTGAVTDSQNMVTELEKELQLPETSHLNARIASHKNNEDATRTYFQEYINRALGQPKPLYEYALYLESIEAWSDAIIVYNELIKKYPKSDYLALSKTGISKAQDNLGNKETIKAPAFNPNLRPGSMKY